MQTPAKTALLGTGDGMDKQLDILGLDARIDFKFSGLILGLLLHPTV